MTSLIGSTRRRELTDIIPPHDDDQNDRSQISGGSTELDQRNNGNCIKIQHLTGSAASGRSRFPRLEECAHFHYEHVELNSLQLTLYEEEDLKSLASLEYNENTENKWLTVKITSQGQSWLLRRTYENFRMLDQQLHQCIYDRKFSLLPELPPLENLPEKQNPHTYLKCQLSKYCERFSSIAGSLINCGPVLNWLQIDNRGRRILVTDGDNCPINTPAVAAAYAVKKYAAVAADEISFDIGDMISVIDMPPPEDSIWWRGKRGFMVGFFPSHYVAIITDKVPHNLQLIQPTTITEPSKPVLRKHGKLIAFFRAFILSRPSKRHLKQSGIFRERVFGCDLGEHLLNSGREVPMVLKCCSEFIERHGIVDGIYRLSGATSNIQKLRTTFDEDRIPALYNDDSILQDIHSVASLLKMYFRELPNPLCTYQLYKHFVTAVQNSESTKRIALMREVVQKLPPPHFRTLEFLMRHLAKVAEHGMRTGMTARNIAIVWAPNLLRCKELEFGGVAALQGVGVQAVVTEFLISNVDLVFCNDQISSKGISKKIRPKSLSLGTPTKLLSLEEAQSKRLGSEHPHDNYIEVGGGPSCLPKIYHTVIELPSRKRLPLKRSPLGWKSFFSRGGSGSTGLRKSSSTNSGKRKPSISTEITYKHEPLKKIDTDVKNRLRTVKSAESLISGVNSTSVRNSTCLEYLSPPSPKLSGPSGHSRSVSHDSYFDHLAEITPIHSTLHQDQEGLSDLQVNFDLDESEIKIFSDESSQLFSNTSSSEQLQQNLKKAPLLASAENTIIVDPSPKKHKTTDSSSCSSVTLSDDMTTVSNKRSRLEEGLFDGDFAYIDSHYPDQLVVEVDVHHRESSQILSSLNETLCSENETVLSSYTMSDTSLTNMNISYTLLSDCSNTTSSNCEPSYQQLSLSVSSSQFPVSSTESLRNYENIPKNRYSYQGELRPNLPVGNRLSLQTLNVTEINSNHHSTIELLTTSKDDCVDAKTNTWEDMNVKNVIIPSQQNKYNYLSEKYNHTKRTDNDEFLIEKKVETGEISVLSNNRLKEHHDNVKSHNALLNAFSDSTESAQYSEYENIQKLKLILSDKDMFSDREKFLYSSTVGESPYELVNVVGNRMTSVSINENQMFLGIDKNYCLNESNYEEVESIRSNHCSLDTKPSHNCTNTDSNYEVISSVYTDSEIYNVEEKFTDSEKKSNYEDIFVKGDTNDYLSSSNESLESSTDEAMIENNLYESLIAEDSSPDFGSNRSFKIIHNKITSLSEKDQGVSYFKNFVETLTVCTENNEEHTNNECSPLLVSETQSPFSDSEQLQFYADIQTNITKNNDQIIKDIKDIPNNTCVDIFNEEQDGNFKIVCERSNSLPLSTEKQMVDDSLNVIQSNSEQLLCIKNNMINPKSLSQSDKMMKTNSLYSGSTKSVLDLVSKFEWTAENDSLNLRKESWKNKTIINEISDKEYFSLPSILIRKKSSQDPLIEHDTDKKDELIRRNRIEKYKEERRLALRQKYQIDDFANDKKDEEMIKRFKQKILKVEKEDNKTFEFDCCTPNEKTGRYNEFSLIKGNIKPSPAVTTISILYTSRRRKDSNEYDNFIEKKKLNESNNESNISSQTVDNSFTFMQNINNNTINSFMEGNVDINSAVLKSFNNVTDKLHECPIKQSTNYDDKRSFTSSLERRTNNKVKSFVKEESLVAKRVNQLSEASELYSSSINRRSVEIGSMRQRAHSASGPIVPYCIRDIAAIFESKDNKQ